MKKYLILTLIIILAALLRLYALNKFPAGLNADEAAIGYNAYSLIQTGRDEHGASWPLVFQSFNDYKPPLYFYLTLPFVKLLGLNIWSVRLPSAFLGIASVYLIYLLANLLFNQGSSSGEGRTLTGAPPDTGGAGPLGQRAEGRSDLIGILAALLLSISPWHIHFSRGAWEANSATFFLVLGVWAFIKALKKSNYFFLSSFSLLASLYAYHSLRIISPLLLVSLIVIYWPSLKVLIKFKAIDKQLLISALLGLVLLLPLVKQMLGKEGTSRFSGVSIFADQGPLWEALERRRNSTHPDSIPIRVIHNKYLSYSRHFIQNYLSHYSPRFLFVEGDEIGRNKVPDVGQSLLILAPFYLIGILNLLKLDTKGKKVVLAWFLIAPLAAALTFQSPHALRSQNMVIPLTIITALGVYQFLKAPHWNLLLGGLLSILLTYSTARYLHQYYFHYPRELPFAWEYGFDQLAAYIKINQAKYDQIIISNRFDQPYIILAFYLKYPPKKFQQETKLEARDKFGFSTVNSFAKFKFKKINWDKDSQVKNALIITSEESVPQEVKPIFQINFPNNQPAFKFYTTNNI